MVMKLEKVIPFGRSLDEYVKMFNLSNEDLAKRILGIADGPASFNVEATNRGSTVISVDPLYQFEGSEILERFNAVVDDVIDQVRATPNDWVWTYHTSPDDLRNNRVNAIHTFIADYEMGKQQGRYQLGELPSLNFCDHEFDLSLCSHFLFLYSDHYDLEFHWDSIQELLRVSQEVRIFPLMTLMLERSPHLPAIIQQLHDEGYDVAIEKVEYELQKGGNEMLVIKQ